jgi:predicted ATPase
LFKNRFRDNGFYLLDEPEAALSPKRRFHFLALLHDYVKRGGQFVIATHSPIIMAYPEAWIYVFSSEGIRRVPYPETEHYQVTRGFLSCPKKSLDVLLAEDDAEESAPPA